MKLNQGLFRSLQTPRRRSGGTPFASFLPPSIAIPDGRQPHLTTDQDWRLQGQDRYLMGATLGLRSYDPSRLGWDHDHCEFCSAKFMAHGEGESLAQGYCTNDAYHWICECCFADFHERFAWRLG